MTSRVIERQVLRVLYSPVRAFEEIAKTPSFKGPLLIFALVMITTAGAQYISASKIFLQFNERYVSLLTFTSFGGLVVPYLINTALHFFINWIMYAAVLFLTIKISRIKTEPWTMFYIRIGYVFSVTIVYILVNAALISALPSINLPTLAWKAWDPQATSEEATVAVEVINQKLQENWYPLLAFQALQYLSYAIDIWTAALCAVAIRSSHEVTWSKAIVISAIASAIVLILRTFIL